MRISSFNINKFCGAYSSINGGYYNPRNIPFKLQIKNIVDNVLRDIDDIIFLQEFIENQYVDVLNLFNKEKYTIFSNSNYKKIKSSVVAMTLKGSTWEKEDFHQEIEFSNKIIEMRMKDLKVLSFHNTDDNIQKIINSYFQEKNVDIIIGDFNNIKWIDTLKEEKMEYRDLVTNEMITYKPAQTAIDRVFIKKEIDSKLIVFNGIIETFASDHNLLSFLLNWIGKK